MKAHRWLGLSFGLVLLVAAATGSALLIAAPLDEALNERLFLAPAAGSVNYQAVLARLKTEIDLGASLTLRPPREQGESFRAIVRGEWRGTVYLHPTTGEILGSREEKDGMTGFLFVLHSSLLAGEAGKAILSLTAFAYVCLLVSGVYLWWPVRWSQAFTIRRAGGSLRTLFDWHRVTGAIFGVLVLISVASGAYMAWPPLAKSISKISGASPMAPPKVLGGPPENYIVERAVKKAEQLFPGSTVGYIQVPVKADQPIRIRLRLLDDPHPNGLTSVWLDPSTAQILQVNRWTELDPGTRAYSYIYPLHTGELWGLSWMVLTFLAGVVLSAYAVTGVLLWWGRRQVGLLPVSKTPCQGGRKNRR